MYEVDVETILKRILEEYSEVNLRGIGGGWTLRVCDEGREVLKLQSPKDLLGMLKDAARMLAEKDKSNYESMDKKSEALRRRSERMSPPRD